MGKTPALWYPAVFSWLPKVGAGGEGVTCEVTTCGADQLAKELKHQTGQWCWLRWFKAKSETSHWPSRLNHIARGKTRPGVNNVAAASLRTLHFSLFPASPSRWTNPWSPTGCREIRDPPPTCPSVWDQVLLSGWGCWVAHFQPLNSITHDLVSEKLECSSRQIGLQESHEKFLIF